MRFFVRILAFLLIISTTLVFAQYGINTRVSNTSLLIDDLPPAAPGTMTITRTFTNLSFSQPVYITEIPDGSGRMLVLEKTGMMKVFPKAGNPTAAQVTTMLNLSDVVATDSEQGLLGIAFDPNYATNGIFYLHYNWNGTSPGTSRISRFVNTPPSSNVVNPATETIILAQSQPYTNHKSGMIDFGPDGMLYVSFGDGGNGGDPGNRAQDSTLLLGKFLRIDVRGAPDPGLQYRIPPDNPFYSGGPAGTATRKEIWAIGMRNPWRWSFDRQTGRLYCGDVGQGTYEEVDIIEKGKNYGWRIMEGLHCFNPSTGCNQTGLTLPIAEYDHGLGSSITGGYVYHGSKYPQLYGMYLYADYGSGRVWGLRYNGSAVDGPFVIVASNSRSISSFGEDSALELYMTDVADGNIYELTPSVPTTSNFPSKLSDIPALLQAGLGNDQTNQGIIPYEPSSKLWSDGTLKSRFMAIPGTDKVVRTTYDGWTFPDKTVLIKNFLLPLDERNPVATAKRIETRLLYQRGAQWYGFSYEWNEAGTDANLLVEGKFKNYTITDRDGLTVNFDYRFPNRGQCNICHTVAAGGVLGLNTPQMNFNFHYPASNVTDNQLHTFDHIGLFTDPLPTSAFYLPRMPDYTDTGETINSRARAYLASNCAQCHRPGGTAPTSMDFRWQTMNSAMNAIEVSPNSGDLGIPFAKIIKPFAANYSVLWHRINRRDQYQMPPLATARIDQDGVALIGDWIGSSEVFGPSNGAGDAHYFK